MRPLVVHGFYVGHCGYLRDIHELRLEVISLGERKRTEEKFG